MQKTKQKQESSQNSHQGQEKFKNGKRRENFESFENKKWGEDEDEDNDNEDRGELVWRLWDEVVWRPKRVFFNVVVGEKQ